MASHHHHHHHHALWAKLGELELQLAAYKLLRAQRGVDAGADASLWATTEATCRGRRYEAYMRRRDARREAKQPLMASRSGRAAAAGGSKPVSSSPRALRCTARDANNSNEVRKTWTVSIPSTPRRDAVALPRSRTVNGGGAGVTGSPARPAHHHQRRSSLGGAPTDFGDSATATTPRPFLKRGTGTGGAVAPPARLRARDIPSSIDVPTTPRPPQGHAHAARHVRSVSELLPFDAASPQAQARARKRWGSPEKLAKLREEAVDSHNRDFSKGLKKLLSFVRKGGRGGDAADRPCTGKPVSSTNGWSGRTAACSLLDAPFDDRASLDGHRFPMTRTVGISG